MSTNTAVNLEPTAQQLVEATAKPPFLFQLPPAQGRQALEDLQNGYAGAPDVDIQDTIVHWSGGDLPVRILRPVGDRGPLPVILFIHGAGWVFGSKHTHDRLIRELCAGTRAAVVFPTYSLSPEARYPTAIEENYATLNWIRGNSAGFGFDATRIAVAGDSVGGNMATVMALMAKARSGPVLTCQLLFYPVTDAGMDTDSYAEFAEGYYLRRDGMHWFWDQYTIDDSERNEITASPLRATREQLKGLPRALVITGEADVLRDEGEAYADKLRLAGVAVTQTRYQAMVHDFVMLNSLRDSCAADGAIKQAITFLRDCFDSAA